MVTYQLSDWIKAGVHLGEASFFQTDQIVPSILDQASRSQRLTEKQDLCGNHFVVCLYIIVLESIVIKIIKLVLLITD